jgi:hypothetical protein
MDFEDVGEGSRIIYRPKYARRISEDVLLERSPSREFVKFKGMGWMSRGELKHYELVEVICSAERACPGCATPEKPEDSKPCRNAPGGSPQLERYLDALELSKYGRLRGDE